MKNFKLILVLFFGIFFMQLKAQSTDFEKIAVGGRAEYTKLNSSEQRTLIIVNRIVLIVNNKMWRAKKFINLYF